LSAPLNVEAVRVKTHISVMTQHSEDKNSPPPSEQALSEILAPGDEARQSRNRTKVQKGFWRTFRKAASVLPFSEDVAAAYYCAMDNQTPMKVRGTLLAALAYFVLPTDLVPDFIMGLGFTDDIAVLTYVFSTMKSNLRPEHYDAARAALENEEFEGKLD
jgi:uncharacterized membrane protein YkvA (DUF1232 family)